MEHLWSRAGANARESRQRADRREPPNYLQSAASSCIRSPATRDGKEGVDGSSPSEGLKSLQISRFCCLVGHDVGCGCGGGQQMADLQAFLPAASPVRRVRGNSEGTPCTLRRAVAPGGEVAVEVVDVLAAETEPDERRRQLLLILRPRRGCRGRSSVSRVCCCSTSRPLRSTRSAVGSSRRRPNAFAQAALRRRASASPRG